MKKMLKIESDTIETIITWMTEKDQKKRPTAADILNHIITVTSKGIDFTFNAKEVQLVKEFVDLNIFQ